VLLCYFNTCGAGQSGELGGCYELEIPLILLVLQVTSGRREAARVFRRDYDPCNRDYVYINDLCGTHALDWVLAVRLGK